MESKIYVARIVYSTSTDGVGLRNSLYVSGCPIHCEGCHNKTFWNKESGEEQTVDAVFAQLNSDQFDVSILGGEPLMQHDAVLELCKKIKKKTNKTIWLWSGYTLKHIQQHFPDILHYIDVLVDGQYVQSLSKPNLLWRGSINQKIYAINTDEHGKCVVQDITDLSDESLDILQ